MPHYTPAGNALAHGLIIAPLLPNTNVDNALDAVKHVVQQGTMTIATVSHFERRQPKGNNPQPGDVLAVFANSSEPIKSTTAHDDTHDLVAAIKLLTDPVTGKKFFSNNVDHW